MERVAATARRWSAVAVAAALSLGFASAAAGETPGRLYILARHQSALWQVDPASGDRALFELFRYPEILAIGRAAVTPSGDVFFTAWNAAQQTGIFAFSPGTGSRAGVSGPALGALGDVVVGPGGSVYALDLGVPAVLAIDPVTGNRSVVSGGREGRGAGEPLPAGIDRPTFATHQPTVLPSGPPPRLPRRRLAPP